VHRALVRAVRALDGVTFHDLYDAYPDFDVDVPREQALLEAHESVVLQHPFYWYSTPALVKQWMDLVLEHGWAYGSSCTALVGKKLLSAVTAGGREESYREGGLNRRTVRDLLAPIELTARLCGMEWLEPFVVHGTHALDPDGIADAARSYAQTVAMLRDGKLG
jgi:glutathione-regulated potassium-efflux system ancillary protein KefG